MQFDSHIDSSGLTLRLNGRLEFTDHERLREMVAQMSRVGDGARIVVDAGELEFIDSAGLGMLLILHEESLERKQTFAIRGVKGGVRRSIELARIDELMTVEP